MQNTRDIVQIGDIHLSLSISLTRSFHVIRMVKKVKKKIYFKVNQGQFYFVSCHLPERIEKTHAKSMPVSQFTFCNNCLRALNREFFGLFQLSIITQEINKVYLGLALDYTEFKIVFI